MTDTTQPNGDRDCFPDRKAALNRNFRPHRWDHVEAAYRKSGKTPEVGW
jgi:hypothetical protein